MLSGTHESVYEYDGESRRIRITEKENGVQTKQETFIWCGSRICQKRSGSTIVRSYFGQGFEQGSEDYFYTRDHLGSVREVVASDGTTVASRVSYDPWGKSAESGAGALTDFGFTGHYLDRPSGLSLPLYRGYSPSLGRWLSRDPIGIDGGFNLYGYVQNDPANAIDPEGTSPWEFGGCVMKGFVTGKFGKCFREEADDFCSGPAGFVCEREFLKMFEWPDAQMCMKGPRSRREPRECICKMRYAPAEVQAQCPPRVFGTGFDKGSCQAAAKQTAPQECRRWYGHCLLVPRK